MSGDSSNSQNGCTLLDWSGTDEIVAEGCFISSDPKELVNQVPLGENAMKVLVDIPTKPNAFLFRPLVGICRMEEAKGKFIAWPADRVILQHEQEYEKQDNISSSSVR